MMEQLIAIGALIVLLGAFVILPLLSLWRSVRHREVWAKAIETWRDIAEEVVYVKETEEEKKTMSKGHFFFLDVLSAHPFFRKRFDTHEDVVNSKEFADLVAFLEEYAWKYFRCLNDLATQLTTATWMMRKKTRRIRIDQLVNRMSHYELVVVQAFAVGTQEEGQTLKDRIERCGLLCNLPKWARGSNRRSTDTQLFSDGGNAPYEQMYDVNAYLQYGIYRPLHPYTNYC